MCLTVFAYTAGSTHRLTFAKSPRSTASRYFFSSSVNGFGKLGPSLSLLITYLVGSGDGASICNPNYETNGKKEARKLLISEFR